MTVGAAVLSATMSPSDREQFLHHTVTGTANARIAADLAATPAQAVDTGYERNRFAHHMFKRGFTFDRYLTYAQTTLATRPRFSPLRRYRRGDRRRPQPALIQGRDVLAAVGGSRKPGPWGWRAGRPRTRPPAPRRLRLPRGGTALITEAIPSRT